MTEQNRWNEGRFRSDTDDDRRSRRRDEEGDWRRDDRERGFRESYGSSGQSFGGFGESERWENPYGDRSARFGSSRREGQSYHGDGSYAGRGFDSNEYGNQRYGGRESGGQRFGSGPWGGYGEYDHRWGSPNYGSQNRGSSQYGGFGVSESGGATWGRDSGYGGSGWQQGSRGEYRGKGPKGYTRSDERIREDVCDRLSADDELDASDITVTVKGGEVTLEGTVADRRAKQRAEDIAESAGGVKDVDNKLRKNKGMLQEMGERLSGNQNGERGGHAGSGTKNASQSTSTSR